jgi:hypothetical protein
MITSYCDKWLANQRSALNVISEDAARERHGKRLPYVALVGISEKPRFIVDLAGKWVSVDFLDSRQRKYLSYNFKETELGRLFLKSAYFWEYVDDGDEVKSTKIFNFSEDGSLVVGVQVGSQTPEEYESMTSVEENWDIYPQFGDYMHLCKEERGLSER